MTVKRTKRERGLYAKYAIKRTDRSDRPGGEHDRCQYFVLDLTHDPHARSAILAYVQSCAAEYPQLASDLLRVASETVDASR